MLDLNFFDENACIHKLFEKNAELDPTKVAIKDENSVLTYQQMNDRANAVARSLKQSGVNKGDAVSIAIGHSPELVVAMLAVLKCGAVYLPIDEALPAACIQGYFDAASVKVCISNKQVAFESYVDASYILIQDAVSYDQGGEFTSEELTGEAAAYIMFTSGSTGTPKAVVVPHRAVIRLVIGTNYITISPEDKILQFAPPSFDASTFEIWGALLNHATLVVYLGKGLDPNKLKRGILNNEVTILWLTAALFHLIVNSFIEVLKPIRVLLAGGDVLNPKYVNHVFDMYPQITLINGYGPTENTTFTCCHVMNTNNRPQGAVPIGRPISGTDIHILNEQLVEVPCEEIGTLYTSGLGVSLGYLSSEKNDKAFFYDETIALGLIYNTGDLVKRTSNGDIEFIGRTDNQVKIRGHRVSLEEVRLHIVELEHICDAVVLVKQSGTGDQLLAAYLKVKVDEEDAVTARDIRAQLSKVVPNYMVPDQVTFCTNLPIKANGKIDKSKIEATVP